MWFSMAPWCGPRPPTWESSPKAYFQNQCVSGPGDAFSHPNEAFEGRRQNVGILHLESTEPGNMISHGAVGRSPEPLVTVVPPLLLEARGTRKSMGSRNMIFHGAVGRSPAAHLGILPKSILSKSMRFRAWGCVFSSEWHF